MPLISGWFYKALTSIGVNEEEARQAAEELAELKIDIVKLEGKISKLEWMVATNVAISLAILLLILNYLVKP